jgi:hypothetical protein
VRSPSQNDCRCVCFGADADVTARTRRCGTKVYLGQLWGSIRDRIQADMLQTASKLSRTHDQRGAGDACRILVTPNQLMSRRTWAWRTTGRGAWDAPGQLRCCPHPRGAPPQELRRNMLVLGLVRTKRAGVTRNSSTVPKHRLNNRQHVTKPAADSLRQEKAQ